MQSCTNAIADVGAVRKHKHAPRAERVHHEKFLLFADDAVVALPCLYMVRLTRIAKIDGAYLFLGLVPVLGLLLVLEGDAVNTLKLLFGLIAQPVCTRHLQGLEPFHLFLNLLNCRKNVEKDLPAQCWQCGAHDKSR